MPFEEASEKYTPSGGYCPGHSDPPSNDPPNSQSNTFSPSQQSSSSPPISSRYIVYAIGIVFIALVFAILFYLYYRGKK